MVGALGDHQGKGFYVGVISKGARAYGRTSKDAKREETKETNLEECQGDQSEEVGAST